MASQKYGNEPIKMSTGGKVESTNPPRRQAAMIPRPFPMMNAKINAVPPRRRVQRICEPITSVTGDGKREIEIPMSPVKTE